MKTLFIKYLLFLMVSIFPCALFSACSDDFTSEKVVYLSSSSSTESILSEETSSEESLQASSSESVSLSDGSAESDDASEGVSSSNESDESDEKDSDSIKDDFSEGDTPQREHHFLTDGADPDCENDGFFKEWCENCDYVRQEYSIPAIGHTVINTDGFAPNCKKEGLTDSSYCGMCGKVFKAATPIPTIPHNFALGLGSCPWCDVSVLRYDVRERQHATLMKQYYAVCLGAEEFTPYSVTRFVNIPDTITIEKDGIVYTNIPVVEIEDRAFLHAYDVNTLIIGANVERIGYRAFDFCVNLREVYDKSQLKVGNLERGENGNITDFVKVEDIHYTANYESKVSVDDDSGCIIYTDDEKVELIGIRDTVAHVIIPEGVTHISSCVFYKTRAIQKLTIAKSVNFIARYAFAFDCERHKEEGHTNEKCKMSLKNIIFLNPNNWCAYEYLGQNCVPFHPAELNETGTGAWQKLALKEYLSWYWKREDYLPT